MNSKSRFDYLIVGAGFFGSTVARILTDAGKSCLVIDKDIHLGGAAHDFIWPTNGQIVCGAGAHIFHTQSEQVWNFVNRFCEMESFINKPKVLTGGKVYSFPLNMMTFHQLWGVVTPEEARQKLNEVRVPCVRPRNFEEWALDKIGPELYELFIYNYTKKQWMKEPRELPSSIIQRLPIRLTYDENYFTAKYQSMPKNGYSELIKTMLDGIDVRLGIDFFTMRDWHDYASHLIYSGPLDRFFGYELGELEYNTMKFVHKTFIGDYQGNAVFNHTDDSVSYLRSIEHKHFQKSYRKHYDPLLEDKKETVVSFDYPVSFKENPEPYYPIRDTKNSSLYEQYSKLAKNISDMSVGGRLGSYRYIDLDQAIAEGMTLANSILE